MNNKLAWGVLLAVGATGAVTYQQGRWHLPGSAAASQSEDESSLALDGAKPHTVRLTDGADLPGIGVTTATVRSSPRPQPLRLPGTLFLDPGRLVHVHSRFAGEVVAMGQIKDGGVNRPLRYGDRVTRGQLLATVWSKEIGEKKSELVDILSRLAINKALLEKLESLTKGIVPERQILEARREAEADMIAATRVERTLRSWRLSEPEIDAVKREAELLQNGKGSVDPEVSRRWAETELRAAISGVIVEKNFNVGDIVEPNDDLIKLADLTRLQVVVNVYAEDLNEVRALPPDQRKWKLAVKSNSEDGAVEGTFDLIGSVIDPAQRTGVLIGWLDNTDGIYAVGQFLTATIELPAEPSLVSLPETALVEDGDQSSVFVMTGKEPASFTRRYVQVVRRTSGDVIVRSEGRFKGSQEPLKAGEIVAARGVFGLSGELATLEAQANSR